MEGIDKARLLSGLLRENGRYKMADSQTRPFIAYEIKLLRKRLGMSTGLPEDVLERVKNNPVDMSKTLTPEEYTKQAQTWMPHSFVSLSGMDAENTKGAAKALQDVILRYPKIVDDNRGIQTFSSSSNFLKMAEASYKRWNEYINEVVERERLLEKVPTALTDKLKEMEEGFFGRFPMRSRIGAVAAEDFAKATNLIKVPEIRKALDRIPVIREDFAKVCMDALKELWAKHQARERLIREHLDLNQWTIYCERIDFRKLDDKGALALHFGDDIGGVLLLSAFKYDNYLQRIHRLSVKEGVHPEGTDGSEMHRAGEAIVMHELGHALDRLLGISTSPEFQKFRLEVLASLDVAKEVSRYATTNNKELIAEAFSEYKLSKAPRPVAMAIGRMIDDAYEKKFGGPK